MNIHVLAMTILHISVFVRYQEDPLIPKANDTNIVAYETTTIFQISIYQYIGLVIAFSTAAPFRKSFLTNCK